MITTLLSFRHEYRNIEEQFVVKGNQDFQPHTRSAKVIDNQHYPSYDPWVPIQPNSKIWKAVFLDPSINSKRGSNISSAGSGSTSWKQKVIWSSAPGEGTKTLSSRLITNWPIWKISEPITARMGYSYLRSEWKFFYSRTKKLQELHKATDLEFSDSRWKFYTTILTNLLAALTNCKIVTNFFTSMKMSIIILVCWTLL